MKPTLLLLPVTPFTYYLCTNNNSSTYTLIFSRKLNKTCILNKFGHEGNPVLVFTRVTFVWFLLINIIKKRMIIETYGRSTRKAFEWNFNILQGHSPITFFLSIYFVSSLLQSFISLHLKCKNTKIFELTLLISLLPSLF